MTVEYPEEINSSSYKYEEIKEHFDDFIKDQSKDWIEEHKEDLHHEVFNTDYYIIGTYKAKQWLKDEVFNVIDYIKEYEQENFGSVSTDFSEPEHVVNTYVYILGDRIINTYRSMKEGMGDFPKAIEDIQPYPINKEALLTNSSEERGY